MRLLVLIRGLHLILAGIVDNSKSDHIIVLGFYKIDVIYKIEEKNIKKHVEKVILTLSNVHKLKNLS